MQATAYQNPQRGQHMSDYRKTEIKRRPNMEGDKDALIKAQANWIRDLRARQFHRTSRIVEWKLDHFNRKASFYIGLLVGAVLNFGIWTCAFFMLILPLINNT